jgi:hypothetical protein
VNPRFRRRSQPFLDAFAGTRTPATPWTNPNGDAGTRGWAWTAAVKLLLELLGVLAILVAGGEAVVER